MNVTMFFFFSVGLPSAAVVIVAFAKRMLMDEIPKIDPEVTKTRTDIYAVRSAYACFIVGVIMFAVWALGITALGIMAGIRLL
jgi:hypothetical protein